jgi:c-di-GMP-binding flagellar brake protein YcgR
MTNAKKTAQSPKLVDLDLRVGQTVQLITQERQPRKYYTRLIGYVDQEFVMLRVPVENGWSVVLDEGQLLEVRVFCGVALYEFQCRLQALLLNPRNYMLLSYPEHIRQVRFRSHERVQCALPVHIAQAPGELASDKGFQFQDLSGSGAALVGPQALGEAGQPVRLQLDFRLAATDTQEQVMLDAVIQKVQALRDPSGRVTGYHHGVHFEKVEPRILLLVSELLRPQMWQV